MSTCVGSLTNYKIRFANQPEGSSDSTGKTIGGHLMEGCKIYTIAEIVIHGINEFIFKREQDGTTEWEELQLEQLKNKE